MKISDFVNPPGYKKYVGYHNYQNGYYWIRVYGVTHSGKEEFICSSSDYPEERQRYMKKYGIDHFSLIGSQGPHNYF